jgi:GTP-binding protein
MDALRHRMAALVSLVRSQRRSAEEADEVLARPVLRPGGSSDAIEVSRVDGGWRVRSDRVERWVVMTDLENEEAVRYLQGRMVRAGVEQALADAGAQRGDAVEIAGAVFDFEPDRADDLLDDFEDDPSDAEEAEDDSEFES